MQEFTKEQMCEFAKAYKAKCIEEMKVVNVEEFLTEWLNDH